MKIRELCEEFVDAVKYSKDEYYEIFKNPTSKEVSDAKSKEFGIRFIIDFKNKSFYIFNDNLLHAAAAKKLKIHYNYPNWDNTDYAFGVGIVVGGKVKNLLSGIDTNDNRKLEIKDGKHDWLDKYIGFIKPRIR